MKKWFTIALLLFPFLPLGAQTAPQNFVQVGHLAYTSQLNDVAAYVDGLGNEYALVGHADGVSIVDLSNPANPVELQNMPGINTIWREIDIYQTYAYVTNEQGDGLRIIDLSTLPATCVYKDTIMNSMNTGHSLMVDGNRLYIHGSDIDNGGSTVFSLADPWRPVRLGAFTGLYVHDAYYRNNIGYLAEVYDGFMEVVDFTNPAAPVSLGSVSTPDQFTHNSWLNAAGDVCFTTDEVDGAVIAAYDITDLNNIVEIDRICSSVSSCQAPPHNVKVLNEYLISSYYRDGIQLVDAARPHNLIEMGWFDSSPLTGGGFDGAWSSDPYLPSGLVLIGDMQEGLFIVQPTFMRGCYLEGIVTDSITGITLPGADITIVSTPSSDISASDGTYATGVSTAGSYQAVYSKFGYVTKTINVTLANGVLNVQNVALAPYGTVNYTINVVEAGTLTPIPTAKVHVVETSIGGQNDYTANGSGVVNDPAFVQGTYEIYAGKWGYKTNVVNTVANSGNSSITVELEKGYYDDFLFDYNWVFSGNANSGEWERGEPQGTFSGGGTEYNPEDDVTSDFGDQALVTGNGGGSTSDDDVDGGNVIAETPSMNLTTYNEPRMKFYRWFANGGGFGGQPDDTLIVRISNGFTNVVVRRVYGANENNWTIDSLDIDDYIAPTANMIVFFDAGDYNNGHLVEAAVDQFEIYDASPTAITRPVNLSADLTVYPNPMGNVTTVEYYVNGAADDLRFTLTDLAGKVVFEKVLSNTQGSFRMEMNLPQGIYVGTLKVNGELVKSMKLVK